MRWFLLALISFQAATCGQKGPLYLPEDEPSAAPDARAAPAGTR